jgi:hypothetical protein
MQNLKSLVFWLKKQEFKVYLIGSLITASIGAWIGPGRWLLMEPSGSIPERIVMTEGIWFGWLWLAFFIAAVLRYKSRGLWLLIGAPFALTWPYILVIKTHVCSVFFCGW